MLEFENRGKRKTKYAVNKPSANSKWYSRSMGLLGTLLLIFLILHWWHFWIPSRITHAGLDEPVVYNNIKMHNMYGLMDETFKSPLVVVVYVLACFSLFWHLVHGFQSAFRTVGVSNNKWLTLARTTGWGYSIIICLAFAMMPVAMYLNWV
jgi:succinate dehydrogenase / fumarate reductase, cytochrome b subunit